MCCSGMYLSNVIPVGSQCPPPVPLYDNSLNTYAACSTLCCTSRCASIPSFTEPAFMTGCSNTNNLTNYYSSISIQMAATQVAGVNLTCILECIPFTNLNPVLNITTSITSVIPTTTPLTTSVIPATTAATQCCTGTYTSDTIPENSTCPPKSPMVFSDWNYSSCPQSCCLTHCLYFDQNQPNTSFVWSECAENSTIFMQEFASLNSRQSLNTNITCTIECDRFKYQNLNSGNDKTGLEMSSLAAPNSTKDKLFITIIMTLVTLFSFLY